VSQRIASAYRDLASAVLELAFEDLKHPVRKPVDKIARDSAILFFEREWFHLYADLLGISHDQLLKRYRNIGVTADRIWRGRKETV
jgi:hypothetical protein